MVDDAAAANANGLRFSRLIVVSSFPGALVPLAGAVAGLGFVSRTTEASQWTSAYVHGLAVITFAGILFFSMLGNATIVSARWVDRPRGLIRWTRYPLWQSLVIFMAIGWFVTAVSNPVEITWLEQTWATGAASASVGACFWAVRRDPVSTDARRARLRRSPDDPFEALDLRQIF